MCFSCFLNLENKGIGVIFLVSIGILYLIDVTFLEDLPLFPSSSSISKENKMIGKAIASFITLTRVTTFVTISTTNSSYSPVVFQKMRSSCYMFWKYSHILIALSEVNSHCNLPISSFVSYSHLSLSSYSSIANLSCAPIPIILHEALSHPGWQAIMIE